MSFVWRRIFRRLRFRHRIGYVYTAPEHRRKGITAHLMKYFAADFKASPALAAFCLSYREWVAAIYQKYNFKPLLLGKNAGPMMLANTGITADFNVFQEKYYLPATSLRAVPGSIKYRYEIDALLKYYLQYAGAPGKRIFASNAVSGFRAAIFMQEDRRGYVYCAVTDDDRCAGWSFCLNPFAFGAENQAPVFDWELHPAYEDQAENFIKQSLGMLAENHVNQAFSYCSSNFADKAALLTRCGFREEAVLQNYCSGSHLRIFRISF